MSSSIESVRREMVDLVDHVSYDDISDLDANWLSLRDALMALPFTRPVAFAPAQRKAPVVAAALEAIDRAYPTNLDELVKLARDFEIESRFGSSDTISDEELKILKKMARDFRQQFGSFLKIRVSSMLRL